MNKQSKRNKTHSGKNDIIDTIFSNKNKWWLILALIVITFISFSPSLKNDFVRWDDHMYVTENELIKDISINDLGKFSENVRGNFHPLTMISLALDYHFFELNPFYYHLKNLVFHLLNTVLVFLFIMKVSRKNLFISFFSALLFGIHPMHVESVAWISERKDILYSFYFLSGLLLYYEYIQKKKIVFYILTFIAFILSCLSKSAAVVFPLILILIDFYENEKISFNHLKSKIVFFLVSILIGIIALKTQSNAGAIEISDYTLWNKIQYSTLAFKNYLIKFFVPYNLNNLHPYPDLSINLGNTFISAILVYGIGFYAIKFAKQIKWFFWGIAFAFITIILVVQFLQIGGSFISERYTYIPYIGIAFVYLKFIEILIKKYARLKKIIVFVLLLQITSFVYITNGQVKVWNNTVSLWENFIEDYPSYSFAYYNLVEFYQLQGDTNKVLVTFNKALAEDNQNHITFTERGRFYLNIKRDRLALNDFEQALSLQNDYYDAIVGEGISNYRIGNYESALISFNNALKLRDDNIEVYNLLGNTYLNFDMKDEALENINKALEINDKYADALNTKALILGQLENDSTAINHLNLIIDNNDQDYVALSNRGAANYNNNNFDLAFEDFNNALKINSSYPNALRGRSAIYYDRKQYLEAIPDITEYLKSDPSNLDMLQRRAFCYMYSNQLNNALIDYNQLISANPQEGEYFQGRGFLHMQLGNNDKALEDFLMANELGIEIDPMVFNTIRN